MQNSTRVVDCVLLAEFDIERGSVLRDCYTSEEELKPWLSSQMLAQIMVPEKCHAREFDRTVFFFPSQQDSVTPEETDGKEEEAKKKEVSETDRVAARRVLCAQDTKEGQLKCLFSLCLNTLDEDAKRGATVKSIGVVTQHRWYAQLEPVMRACMREYYAVCKISEVGSAARTAVLQKLFEVLSSEQTLVQLDKGGNTEVFLSRILRGMYDTSPACDWDMLQVPWADEGGENSVVELRVPTFLANDECSEASLEWLLGIFGTDIMHIYAAILCGKRVVFLGASAWEASRAVVSSCQLISSRGEEGAILGTLARCFPYVNLTDLSFMQMRGFIAGGVNLLFQLNEQWYDVCASVIDGSVRLSKEYTEQLNLADVRVREELDLRFVKDVLACKAGERWTREFFASYTEQTLRVVFGRELFASNDAQQLFLRANQYRMNSFCRSFQYQIHASHEARRLVRSPFDSEEHHHAVLRDILTLRSMPMLPAVRIQETLQRLLDACGTPKRVEQVLCWMLPVDGGLFCIASLLLHRKLAVRTLSCKLLACLERSSEAGKELLGRLNHFMLSAYRRASKNL